MKFITAPIRIPWNWFKRQSWKKKLVVIVVLLIVGIMVIRTISSQSNTPDYELEAARLDSITEIVSETGNVTTAGAIPVYSTTTGMVEEVFVDNGDTVSENQILVTVKSTATKQQQEAALASYMTAKNQLEAAKATELSLQATMFSKWDTFKDLAETGQYEDGDGNPIETERNVAEFIVPEKQWLSAEEAYKNQQQVVSQAQVSASAAWRAYQATQDSKVESLFNGQAKNVSVAPGTLVTAPTSTTLASTTPVLLIVDESIVPTIKIEVNENDVLKIAKGQTATVEFDAIDNKIFDAIVTRVDSISTTSQDVVTFGVYLEITNPTDQIRSGLTADVEVTVSSKENVLTVPSSSIKPYQGGRAVRVVGEDGEIEFIPVEVGSKGNSRTEIISGIDEGTQVIVALENDQVQQSGGLF